MPDPGLVYILSNSSAQRTIKVGRTNDLKRRLREHNAISTVVGRWEPYWTLEVPDTVKAEKLALNALSRWKVKGRREQFECDPDQAVDEVSVALAEWSEWGKQEAERREEELKQQRELRRLQEAKQAAAIEEEKELETLAMLRKTFTIRKKEYERAKRVISGQESPNNPYPWGLSEPCLAIAFVGAVYFLKSQGLGQWPMLVFMGLWFIKPSIDVWSRFKNWWDYDLNRERHAIENFELVYPGGKPPETLEEVRANNARIAAKYIE